MFIFNYQLLGKFNKIKIYNEILSKFQIKEDININIYSL